MEINKTIKLPEGCTEIKIKIGCLDDNPESRPCLGYISFVDETYQEVGSSEVIVEDRIIVDLDLNGCVRGIEILL